MQQDFHFDVIYCLCRCAGHPPEESRIVAAASQFTEERTFMGPVRKRGGEEYRPVQTYPGGLAVIERSIQESVLRPFHFMGGEGEDRVVMPGKTAACGLAKKAAALAASSAEYGLYALGIALHSLADTFSHQGFHPI